MMELLSCFFALGLIFELINCSQVFGSSCPPSDHIRCSCYTFEDGLFLECEHTTPMDIKNSLTFIKYRIESLNINNLDIDVVEFPPDLLKQSQIQYLHISNSEISSFSPGAFHGQENYIHALSVLNSKITAIPRESIKLLKFLKVLDLSYNYIREIPSYSFYGLSITKLTLQNNIVDSLLEYSFAGLEHSLTELSIANNRLDEFPLLALRRLRNLRVLTITWNSIMKIRSDKHTRLEDLLKLDIGHNKIEKIDEDIFSSMPELTSLSLSTNKIRHIDANAFISLGNLESLNLAHNNLVELKENTFAPVQSIRMLDISSNHLHTIENAFQNLPNLTELFLADNNIRHIDNSTFINSTTIRTLHLQDNAIEVLESNSLSGLSDLFQLQLSNNFINELSTGLFRHNSKLEMLSLDENRLQTLVSGTFDHTTNLRALRLQDNEIKYLQKGTFQSLPYLQELHLQNNKIEVIEDDALESLPKLRHLNMKKNFLNLFGSILHHKNSELQFLQLDGNKIAEVKDGSLTGLGILEVLRLNDNSLVKLTKKTFKSTSKLKHLYLNNNSISHIEDGSFSALENLIYLNLEDNKIGHLESGMFKGLQSLMELYLSNNPIIDIRPDSFRPLPTLGSLHLSGGKSLSLKQDVFSTLTITDLCIKDSHFLVIDEDTFAKIDSLGTLTVKDIKSISVDNSLLHLPNLRSLHISNTQLKFDQFFSDGMSNMDNLRLESCDLDVLREDLINHLKTLTSLSLGFNRLSSLPHQSMRNLHYLQELNIESNRFRKIPHSSINGQLTTLNLASNELSRLDSDSFGQRNLVITDLNISRNSLKVIGERVFHAVQEVEILDLSYNVIQIIVIDAFSKLLKLTRIFLGYNKLLYLPNALFNPNLKHLAFIDVTYNPITRIREDLSVSSEVVSLSHLVISKTNLSILTSQDFIGSPKVMQLTLSDNKVSRISPGAFGSLRILQMLDLSNNSLEIVPSERLSGLFNLRSLNLSMNNLERLNKFGKNHKQLDQLDISYNKLAKIFSWNFNPLVQLKVLLAHHNRISWIDKDAFENLTSLRDLDISHNKLVHIDGGFLDPIESSLEILKIKGNPFECDCSFSTSWLWIQNHKKLLDRQPILCSSPKRLSGRSVWHHNFEYFCAMPLISELEIQPLRHDQLTVQWRVRNQSKVRGVKVVYHSSSQQAQLSSGVLKPPKNEYNIQHLRPATWYTVCIVAMSSEPTESSIGFIKGSHGPPGGAFGGTSDNAERCVKIKTPEKNLGSRTNWTSLAIILGCTLGVVLVLGVSITLTALKFYKIRQNRKRRTPKNDVPQEYLSYRHFSLQSIERMFEET